MATITAANSAYAIAVTNLFPSPQTMQGFSADAMFSVEEADIAEIVMGVDGKLSAGFVFSPTPQNISIMPDSPSSSMFETWYNTSKAARDVYFANATIIMPAIKRKYTLTKGVLTKGKAMPDAKKTLQPREWKITWESITGEDYNG
jgi:hypothetical protein